MLCQFLFPLSSEVRGGRERKEILGEIGFEIKSSFRCIFYLKLKIMIPLESIQSQRLKV